jgi:hypothetical protein
MDSNMPSNDVHTRERHPREKIWDGKEWEGKAVTEAQELGVDERRTIDPGIHPPIRISKLRIRGAS